MSIIAWNRYPLVSQNTQAKNWLQLQTNLAPNTIDAYGRALNDYLAFCARCEIVPTTATNEHLSLYVSDLTTRPHKLNANVYSLNSSPGLSNATLQQRLTAVRLFYDYLVEEGVRRVNPVGRGRYTPGKAFSGKRDRGLIPRYRKLPWLPTEEEWRKVLEAARSEPLRNRLMLAMSYDAGLRREELCSLTTADFDPAHHLITVRAETTKSRQSRVVPYSSSTAVLYAAYLQERRKLTRSGGPLFLSISRRNHALPISIWTWSKAVRGIALSSGVPRFTTHTPRHLCLTDLARAGWDIHEIATFAGHRSTQTTLLYIHLSGIDLAQKLQHGMTAIHSWRMKVLSEIFDKNQEVCDGIRED
jgi:integrase/recombinase XerD